MIQIMLWILDFDFLAGYKRNVTYQLNNYWSLHFLLSAVSIYNYNVTHTDLIFVYRILNSVLECH